MGVMRRAVTRNFVSAAHANFVEHGLRWGFEVGVKRHLLRGQRVFKNYDSATGDFRMQVAEAVGKRVLAQKTVEVAEWTEDMRVLRKSELLHVALFYVALPLLLSRMWRLSRRRFHLCSLAQHQDRRLGGRWSIWSYLHTALGLSPRRLDFLFLTRGHFSDTCFCLDVWLSPFYGCAISLIEVMG